MQITSISQNELNQIENANTLEDLQNLKNLIKSSIIQNNNEDYNYMNCFAIRIMSKEEYNKYIINDTLNGAVIANNINTYHYIKNPIGNSYCYINYYSGSISFSWNDLKQYLTHQNYQYIYNNNNYNYTIIYELCVDNSTNQFIAINQQQCVCDAVICSQYDRGKKVYYSNCRQAFTTNYLINKNINYKNLSVNATYNNSKIQFIFDVFIMFRPVFQYKDNNKSKNIYC